MYEVGNIIGTGAKLRISKCAANQSAIFTGGSGEGKTEAMKKISRKMNEDGWNVLVFNFNGTHDEILSDSLNYSVKRVKREGVPLPLFDCFSSMNGEKEDEADVCESVVEAFSQVTKMGYKAKYLLNQACHDAMGMRNANDDMRCLHKAILSLEDDEKTSLLAKYSNILTRVKFSKKFDLWEPGKISVLDFSGYPSATQLILTQLVMLVLWRQHQISGQQMAERTTLVLDEFQNLPLNDHSVLAQILREGRKFNLSLLLATQTLFTFDMKKRLVLQQPATKFYFKPVEAELKRIAKQIPDMESESAEKILQGLKIGECLACGEFEIAGRSKFRTIKVSFRER